MTDQLNLPTGNSTAQLISKDILPLSASEYSIHQTHPTPLYNILLAALVMTAIQIALFLLYTWNGSLTQTYLDICRFDCHWYANIALRGYHNISPIPTAPDLWQTNVAFFPGLPLLGRLVMLLTHTDAQTAIVIASQCATFVFWVYFLVLLWTWCPTSIIRIAACIGVIVHPISFMMMQGYSESLFMASLLGYMYWSNRAMRSGSPGQWALAAVHGIIMTLTRILGVSVILYPMFLIIFLALQENYWKRFFQKFCSAVALSIAALCGALAFFLYCFVAFGEWNLYMQVQSASWGNKIDYLNIFRLTSYTSFTK
ncbi:MAG: hypothetical protein WCI88_08905 [Chloroflexota bacterium]